MKLTITRTDLRYVVDGVPVRVWSGVSESGSTCLVLVHRVGVVDSGDEGEFVEALGPPVPAPVVVRPIDDGP